MWRNHWLLMTVLITLIVGTIGASLNTAADVYGLFRNPSHRALPVYGDERVAKYLLSTRYVQSNFDGALIGSSVSANWDVGRMHSVRLYNESLNGGNIVEEQAILRQLLGHPGTRVVLLVVHPYLTASHEFNTVRLSPDEVWGALGSTNLFDAYKDALKIRLGRESQAFDEAGTEDFGDAAKKLNAHLQSMLAPGAEFEVDPIAMQAYHSVVAELHARGIPIVFVVPPTAEPIFQTKRMAFVHYAEKILSDRQARDRVLDFSGDEFRPFRTDPSHFSDGVHMRGPGAAEVTRMIDEQIGHWIAAGWLSAHG